jgi:hypothetical protein
MIRRTLSLPELGLIAGTRVALGAGIGLLVHLALEIILTPNPLPEYRERG